MDLLEAFKSYLLGQKTNASKVTAKNYIADIRKFILWYERTYTSSFKPESISGNTIAAFKSTLSEVNSINSVERYISSLRKFYAYLKEEGILNISPFDSIQTIEKTRNDLWHLHEFKNYLYIQNASRLTVKNYIIDLKQFFEWISSTTTSDPIKAINNNTIDTYKNALSQETLSPLSINRKLSSLRKYIGWASEKGFINPFVVSKEINNLPTPIQEQSLARLSQQSDTGYLKSFHTPIETKPQIKPYSAIPPVRLFQKLIKLTRAISEVLIVIPLAKLSLAAGFLLWMIQGKPVFTKRSKTATDTVNPRTIHNISLRENAKKSPFHNLYKKTPEWFKKYQNYSFAYYLNIVIVTVFISAIAFALYTQFVLEPRIKTRALAALPTAPPRILSFQGRLTDSSDNPITSRTDLRFAIYNDSVATGSALLWQENLSVTPDTDGIFSTLLGNNTSIPSTLFSQNASLYLGVTVAQTPELTPRQQLATVAYASNSETLQGLVPITAAGAGTTNVVLALDSSGNLSIGGSANPVFQATGGQFKLSGQPLVLATNAGSNGNIQLSPDGLGQIDAQRPLFNSTANNNIPSAAGAVEIDDLLAVLATSSGQSAFTINQNSTGPLITASKSGVTKFNIDNNGNIGFAGNTNFITTLNSAATANRTITFPDAAGTICLSGQTCATSGTVGYFQRTTSGGINYLAPATLGDQLTIGLATPTLSNAGFYVESNNFNTKGNALVAINQLGAGPIFTASQAGNAKFVIDNAGNLGVGTTIPSESLQVAGGNILLDNNQWIKFKDSGGTAQNVLQISNADNVILQNAKQNGNISLQTTNTNSANARITLYTQNVERIRLDANGNLGINTTSPLGVLDIRGNNVNGTNTMSGIIPIASLSGQTSFAALTVDNSGVGDLLTASSSGLTRFTIGQTGNISDATYAGANAVLYAAPTTGLFTTATTTTGSQCLVSAAGSSGTPSWGACSGGSNFWQHATNNSNQVLAPATLTDELSVGNTGTASFLPFSSLYVEPAINSKGNALFAINQTGAGPIFTASQGGTPKFVIDNAGNVGIAMNTPGSNLDIEPTLTGTSNQQAENIITGLNPASTNSGDSASLALDTVVSSGNSQNFTSNVFGAFFNVDHKGTGTVTSAKGYQGKVSNRVGGTITTATGIYSIIQNLGAGTITKGFGLQVDSPVNSGGGTFSNAAGIDILSQTAAGNNTNLLIGTATVPTGNFSIYNSSTNTNYFAGALGIGVTSPLASSGLHVGVNSLGNATEVVDNTGGGGDIFTASSAGSPKFVIDKNGNVGVGTTTPSEMLDIASSSVANLLLEGTANNATSELDFTSINGAGSAKKSSIQNSSVGKLIFNTGGTNNPRMTIFPSGNIAIGTITDNNPLNISINGQTNSGTVAIASISGQTSFAALTVDNSGVGDLFTASSSGMNRFVITQAGNVGVGTTNPSSFMVQVAGNVGPNATNTYNLGSSSLEWNNIYANNIITPLGTNGQNGLWQLNAGALAPANITNDLLVGGSATGSATPFQVYGQAFNNGKSIPAGTASSAGQLTFTASTQLNLLNNATFGVFNSVGGDAGEGANPALFISSSGNVGIGGVTNPTAVLQIAGNLGANASRVYNIGSSTTPFNGFFGNGLYAVGSTGSFMQIAGVGLQVDKDTLGNAAAIVDQRSPTGDILSASQGGSLKFIIKNGGSVGIGTATPLAQTGLDIEKNSLGNAALVVANTGRSGDIFTASSGATPEFVINASGNVGVGTTNPGASLDLASGTIQGAGLSGDCSGTSSKLLWSSSSKQFSCGTDKPSVMVIKSANQTVNSSTTLVNDTDLKFSVNANETWIVHLVMGLNTTSTAGWSADFTAPTGTTCAYGFENPSGSNDNNACATLVSQSQAPQITSFDGSFAMGANSGTVQFQWAQKTATATNTVVHGNQSYLLAYKTTGADYAETYYTKDSSIDAGTVVSIDGSLSAGFKKSQVPYDKGLMGVVSTKPGDIIGDYQSQGKPMPIALDGRVPVKVNLENGPIKAGDYLTSSSTPGVAMKATQAGEVIGKALTDYDGFAGAEGEVIVYLQRGWADPTVTITDVGTLHLSPDDSASNSPSLSANYTLSDAQGTIIQKIAAFSQAVIASVQVGAFDAKTALIDTFNATTAHLANLTADKIISPVAEIDTLHTKIISPVGDDGQIALSINNDNIEVKNGTSGSAVARIDNQGNEKLSGNLQVDKDASISGTLHAGKIYADEIVGLPAATSSSTIINNITNIYESSPSATPPPTLTLTPTPTATPSSSPVASDSAIATTSGILNQLTQKETTNSYTDLASYSAYLSYVPHLNDATFGATGPDTTQVQSFSDLAVGGTLSVGSRLVLADNSINVLGGDLELQPLKQGGVSIADGSVYIDSTGNLTVHGDATFTGNLAANIISPLADHNLTISLNNKSATNSADAIQPQLDIKNASGSGIFAINQLGDIIASGAATISKLNLQVAPQAMAVSDIEQVASGSAGTATIKAYKTEVTIDNTQVTDHSLIYITPVGPTDGNAPYLLRQVPGKSFSVGIQVPNTDNTVFNWLIIN